MIQLDYREEFIMSDPVELITNTNSVEKANPVAPEKKGSTGDFPYDSSSPVPKTMEGLREQMPEVHDRMIRSLAQNMIRQTNHFAEKMKEINRKYREG